MSMRERIETDLKTAMKARESERTTTLRSVLAAIKNHEAEKGTQGQTSDEVVIELIGKESKRRAEAAQAYEEGGRPELAEKERREAEILQAYLPEQLSEAEIAEAVDAAIAEVDAQGPRDIGKVMGAVMPKVKGRADGTRVNAVVRERLGG